MPVVTALPRPVPGCGVRPGAGFGPDRARGIAKQVFDNAQSVPFSIARELDPDTAVEAGGGVIDV